MTTKNLAPLGPKVIERLNELGITTREDLIRRGAVNVFGDLLAIANGRPTPRCYYLFGLVAAIEGKRWNDLSATRRKEIANRAGSGKES